MSEVAALIADMVRAGVDPDLIGRTAEAIAGAPKPRSAHAIRQERYRERHKASLVTESDAFALPSKEGPHTPKETQPTLPTTQQEKTPKGVQKKASRLPPDWQLPEGWGRDAIEAGLPAHLIDLEASKMRDWSLSAPAAKAVKTDWRAAWRNWCRGAVERLPQARGSPRPVESLIDTLSFRMDYADEQSTPDIEGYQAAPLRLSAG